MMFFMTGAGWGPAAGGLFHVSEEGEVDGGFLPAAGEGVVQVGGIELWLQEKGVMPFVGVHGDHHG